MYIGGVDVHGLHHLVWEILDNSVDEAINGFATRIDVSLSKDGREIEIEDDGRGIPVDVHPETKRPALETILTTLHAGGKFDPGNYIHSGGLHGVGASVVNALSEELVATVRRDGAAFEQTFRRGIPTGKMKELGPARGHGTSIRFRPDPEIFETDELDPERIREVLEARAYLHRGLRIVWDDRKSGTKEEFVFDEGVGAWLRKLVAEKGKKPTADFVFYLSREDEPRMELALQWTDDTNEMVRSYVNGIHTSSGGTHEQGLRNAVVKAVRGYMDSHDLNPRGVSVTAEDIREGIVAIFSLYVLQPQFQGQTKERLNNPEVTAPVTAAIASALEPFFNSNRSIADAIVARGILAARARAASRAAVQEVKRKSAVSHRLNLPGKLADCESTDPADSELFIVEGDSAGGTAKQARDRKTQAILPLRGKVLNTEQANLTKITANREINDIALALGCGLGKSFSRDALRYHKIIILTDADSDGHHIATLLLTFFYRHLPGLIREGHVYLGMPPLFRIEHGGKTFWEWDEEGRERRVAELGGSLRHDAITRFKGLGEMNPGQLKETTMDPRTRQIERVVIPSELEADRVVEELMGRDPAPRYKFVMERGREAGDLDV
jgi:DNA gyrase subunit B/topoisomerase-4 subunit B